MMLAKYQGESFFGQIEERLNELGVPTDFFTEQRCDRFVNDGWVLYVFDLDKDMKQAVLVDPGNPKNYL